MAGADDIVKQALRLVMGGGGDDAAKVALRQSAQQATDIPAHLRPGFKVEAAPGADEETRNLVDYLSQRDPSLSFDPQSLAERRQDLGTTVPAFHGSPRNIERFTNQYSSPEGYWGGHHYFTTSPVDASVNYATPEGADLFRRLEGSVERTLDNFHPGDVTEWYAGKYGSSEGINPVDPKIVKEYADDIARQELGITNEGAVYPVNLRMKNPVKIDSPNQTFWGYDTQYDEAGDIVSEGGPAADLLQATRDALADYNVRDREADELIGKLYEAAVDYGGIDAKSYNDILRGSHMDLYDEEGNMVSMGHVMADAFRRMGHDSIDMPTDVFAGGLGRVGMAGTGGDTRHYIIFDPKNVRSRFGAFDPFKAASERISDAEGGAIEGAMRTASKQGGAVGREGYASKGRVGVVKNVIEGIANAVIGRSPNRVFPELASRYPEVKDPVTAFDKKTGKEYLAKDLSPEALAVEQARKVIQKDIDAGQYQPFFDVKARADVDPFNYPSTGKTIDVKPVKPETQAKYRAMAFNPEGLARLREGYTAGLEQKDVAENWYFVKQLEDKFVEEYGPEEGRRLFKERFAKPMALTTGGADPTSNLLMSYYGNFLREKGLPIPEAAYEMPYPIGGRFASSNMGMFSRNMEKELTPDNPKRLNFQNNFLGYKEPTIDEQMSKGFDPKLQMPEWYGPYEEAINMLAREYEVDPRYFQEVAWAGLKSKGKGGYQGMPMIQHINEAIERTSRLTGVPPEDVVRRGLVRGEMPIYGIAAPAGALAVGAMGEDAEEDIDNAVRIAKGVGGATPQDDMQATYAALESANVPQSAAPVEPRYPDKAAQQMAAKKAYIAEAMGGIRRDREPTDLEYWNAMPPEARAEFAAQYPELGEEMRLASEVDYYENAQRAKASQPYSTQSMTHNAPVPRREMKINMPLLGGEYSMGTAPYNVAEGLQGMAQGAYDFKTMPAYFFPPTAPFALAADAAESRLADDPVGLLANVMLTPAGGRLAKDISRPVVNKALSLTRGY